MTMMFPNEASIPHSTVHITDRGQLVDVDTVEHTQDLLLETFNRYANWSRKHSNTQLTRSLSSCTRQTPSSVQTQYWPRIFMALTELRSITLCNQGLFVERAFSATCDQLPWYFHELFQGSQVSLGVETESDVSIPINDRPGSWFVYFHWPVLEMDMFTYVPAC